jgi:hypothetical protein
MGHHRRRRSTIRSILARVARAQDDPTARQARCRAGHGRRSSITVRVACGYVTLEGWPFGPVYLSPLQVGQLRGLLREAVIGLDSPAAIAPPQRRAAAVALRRRRRLVRMKARGRPTVEDVVGRLSGDLG